MDEYISGYFFSPDGQTVNGVTQLNLWNCGPIPDGFLCYVRCKIGDYPDSVGQTTELPDADIGFADPEQLSPVLISLLSQGVMTAESLSTCPPSQQALYARLQADPRDWDTLIALFGSFLSPAYLAGSWDELMELQPDLLVTSKDDEGNEFQNIMRCSIDI